ncbi:Peptidyl-prolyl cis-trans isomerase [Rhynchospora pubera]|uniref:Peptidyl-prolyl cis-trans isomerase n=1 Tax=Rhynchospora pubera TaxID=906938 RepID=A0AAV8FM05_9POAL|nr:Peptidyl-prolyl cis-trans isomerase [Rhynchospora pubera]
MNQLIQTLSKPNPNSSILVPPRKLSRRAVAIVGPTLPLLLSPLSPFPSLAQSNGDDAITASPQFNQVVTDFCKDPPISPKQAFLDVSIDGEPAGRIVIGLYGDTVPLGSSRFAGLVSGATGISYRRKEFIKIVPNYVQHAGVRSYGIDVELAQRTGSDLSASNNLVTEWDETSKRCPGTKNVSGSVGIVVLDPNKPPPKPKLVARQGRLEIDQEEVGLAPNGTEFTIALKDAPELDASTLVVGKVLDGMDVVKKIALVKTVKENTSSPYFRVAKLIGDKRAVVAERGFNRPYSKVVVTNSGLID